VLPNLPGEKISSSLNISNIRKRGYRFQQDIQRKMNPSIQQLSEKPRRKQGSKI
jgi:DNA-binding winged helix-turn-helix (wHTH) protein